jgi:hypothetical protein
MNTSGTKEELRSRELGTHLIIIIEHAGHGFPLRHNFLSSQ